MAFTKPGAATQVGALSLLVVTQADGSQRGIIEGQPITATGEEVGEPRRTDAQDELTAAERNAILAALTRIRTKYNAILGS